jgi:tRNA-Thr(GGU) m(6)t(6)A37 methyltransferase TsaA
LITYLHKVKKHHLEVTPFLDTEVRGLFATRAPCRPNHFGLSCVKLEKIVGNVLHLAEVDLLDETPILDIKPYVADFDSYPNSKAGWYDQKKNQSQTRADERFK